ncbi:unnamed protein product [Amoebophrya sp. A25]|nr:unnamed protein product [Amoebophrya sp. A25]|eukprot:GSA25T00008589001.1
MKKLMSSISWSIPPSSWGDPTGKIAWKRPTSKSKKSAVCGRDNDIGKGGSSIVRAPSTREKAIVGSDGRTTTTTRTSKSTSTGGVAASSRLSGKPVGGALGGDIDNPEQLFEDPVTEYDGAADEDYDGGGVLLVSQEDLSTTNTLLSTEQGSDCASCRAPSTRLARATSTQLQEQNFREGSTPCPPRRILKWKAALPPATCRHPRVYLDLEEHQSHDVDLLPKIQEQVLGEHQEHEHLVEEQIVDFHCDIVSVTWHRTEGQLQIEFSAVGEASADLGADVVDVQLGKPMKAARVITPFAELRPISFLQHSYRKCEIRQQDSKDGDDMSEGVSSSFFEDVSPRPRSNEGEEHHPPPPSEQARSGGGSVADAAASPPCDEGKERSSSTSPAGTRTTPIRVLPPGTPLAASNANTTTRRTSTASTAAPSSTSRSSSTSPQYHINLHVVRRREVIEGTLRFALSESQVHEEGRASRGQELFLFEFAPGWTLLPLDSYLQLGRSRRSSSKESRSKTSTPSQALPAIFRNTSLSSSRASAMSGTGTRLINTDPHCSSTLHAPPQQQHITTLQLMDDTVRFRVIDAHWVTAASMSGGYNEQLMELRITCCTMIKQDEHLQKANVARRREQEFLDEKIDLHRELLLKGCRLLILQQELPNYNSSGAVGKSSSEHSTSSDIKQDALPLLSLDATEVRTHALELEDVFNKTIPTRTFLHQMQFDLSRSDVETIRRKTFYMMENKINNAAASSTATGTFNTAAQDNYSASSSMNPFNINHNNLTMTTSIASFLFDCCFLKFEGSLVNGPLRVAPVLPLKRFLEEDPSRIAWGELLRQDDYIMQRLHREQMMEDQQQSMLATSSQVVPNLSGSSADEPTSNSSSSRMCCIPVDQPRSRPPNVDMNKNVCVICMTNRVSATFVHPPTGHNVCCLSCANRLFDSDAPFCPVCRLPIACVVETFGAASLL